MNCTPLLVDLFVYFYEAECVQKLLQGIKKKNNKKKLAVSSNHMFRYIDNVLSFNNHNFVSNLEIGQITYIWKGSSKIVEYVFNSMIDWLIIYGFTSRSRIFHLYGDVTIASEGLQNLGLCSALRAFEQGGIYTVPHLLWHRTSVFLVSSKGQPHLVAFYDTRGDVEDLF
jgi:hypothetical protein